MYEEIIKVIDTLAAKLGVAIDWSAANVAPYLQQLAERYIGYKITSNIYETVAWVLAAIVFWVLFSICYRKSEWNQYGFDDNDGWCIGAMACGIIGTAATVVSTIMFFVCGHEIIACIMLPEKVILEYLKGII